MHRGYKCFHREKGYLRENRSNSLGAMSVTDTKRKEKTHVLVKSIAFSFRPKSRTDYIVNN